MLKPISIIFFLLLSTSVMGAEMPKFFHGTWAENCETDTPITVNEEKLIYDGAECYPIFVKFNKKEQRYEVLSECHKYFIKLTKNVVIDVLTADKIVLLDKTFNKCEPK